MPSSDPPERGTTFVMPRRTSDRHAPPVSLEWREHPRDRGPAGSGCWSFLGDEQGRRDHRYQERVSLRRPFRGLLSAKRSARSYYWLRIPSSPRSKGEKREAGTLAQDLLGHRIESRK